MKRWFVSFLLATAAAVAYALPSVADVEAQIQQGHYDQAQSMMQEVVAAKPDNARAHYIYAEVLAHNARFADAAREAARARSLDPALRFTEPARFNAFEQQLEREQARAAPAAPRSGGSSSLDRLGPAAAALPAAIAPAERVVPASASGVPGIVWLLIIAVFAIVVWRFVRRNPPAGVPGVAGTAMPATSNGPYGPGAPVGNAGGYPPYGPGGVAPSAGAGLLGTGLAAAGGVAAGMMAERWLEREREQHAAGNTAWNDGGNGAAPSSDPDASALENRNIDFGSGGDSWDAGSGGDGGSIDTGSSGGDW